MGAAGPGDSGTPDPRVGVVLQERYRIIAPLGSGTMGSVYRGERLQLGRPVAIKFLHTALGHDQHLVKRFQVEAMAMSRLAHPNCISVTDFGMADMPYLVMDFAHGMSLREAMQGPLGADRAIHIGRQILAALAHAHGHGIIHRDIKPENVLLEAGPGLQDHVRVLDFGLAKIVDREQGLTQGLALGTPAYMAPEQMRAGAVDARVDLYATGILIFEMLSGRKPFDAPDVGEILRQHLQVPPPRLREVLPNGKFSAELEDVLIRSMAKEPSQRFESALAMEAALAAVPEARPRGRGASAELTIRDPTLMIIPDGPAPVGVPRIASLAKTVGSVVVPWVRRAAVAVGVGARNGLAWIRTDRRRVFAVGGTLGFVFALVLVLAMGAARQRAAPKAAADRTDSERVKPGTAPAARPSPSPSEDVTLNLAAVDALIATGERDRAAKMLVEFRQKSPREPEYPARLAHLYFEKHFWTAGIEAFRGAIRNDPNRRNDAALVGQAINALQSDRAHDETGRFLRELGPEAKARVKKAAKDHPSPTVRKRAGELTRRWNCRGIFCP